MERLISLQKDVIYGPVASKRLGRSLGINLLSTKFKVCSFDCLYCFYGRTDFKEGFKEWTPLPVIIEKIEMALRKSPAIDYITFSGNGEPTMYPHFKEVVDEVVRLRAKYLPWVPIALLSNSSFLTEPKVREALSKIDLPIFKLDCADEETFRVLNRARKDLRISTIIENLASLDSPTLQIVVVGNGVRNFEGAIFGAWLEAVKKIKPRMVQVYTLDESLPSMGVEQVNSKVLLDLAACLEGEIGIKSKAFIPDPLFLKTSR